MMEPWSIATGLVLFVGAVFAGLSKTKLEARSRAVAASLLATCASATAFFVPWWSGDSFATRVGIHDVQHRLLLAGLANSLIALLASAMAPLRSHGQSTFRTMLLLAALGSGFLGSPRPLVLAVLWAASSIFAFIELRRTEGARDSARLFAIYHGSSVILFGSGAVLLEQGQTSVAALLLLFSIAIREAVLPVHSWLPRFVEAAPLGLVVTFVALQLGIYAQLGPLRDVVPPWLTQIVARMGGISALYAALLALGPTDVRRIAAYFVMSQTSQIAFGLENHSLLGWTGAVLMWFVQALGVSAFLLALGALEARRGVLHLGKSAGDPHQVPRLATATLLVGLATVGVPLTFGFVTEDLLIQGSVDEHPILDLLFVVTTALNALTVLRIYFGVFTAGPHRPGELDLGRREFAVLSLILFVLLVFGLFPGPLVAFIH